MTIIMGILKTFISGLRNMKSEFQALEEDSDSDEDEKNKIKDILTKIYA